MFNKNFFVFLICSIIYPLPALAHAFFGKIGFYDGISHPVLGLDHFLAMISVGILSAQIGGRAIWTVPSTFVIIMTIGGLFGFLLIIDECPVDDIFGCMDPTACNYNMEATLNDESCDFDCYGCTNPASCNYDIDATIPCSDCCDITSCYGCMNENACDYNPTAISSILLRFTGVIFGVYGIYLLIGIF